MRTGSLITMGQLIMHTLPRTLITSIALLSTTLASGASTVDVRVSGTLIPSACTPLMSTDSLHFGTVSSADLNREQPTALVEHAPTLTIACGTPTLYGLRLLDNRAGSAYDTGRAASLGLGHTLAGEQVGAYHLDVIPARSSIDGGQVFLSLGDRTGHHWQTSTAQPQSLPVDGGLLGLVDRPGVRSGAVPVEWAQLGIRAHGIIAPAQGLTVTDAVPLDGHVTVEVVYL
ncbi:DUF1120 domain-containing protein [Pseudomonas sp. PS01301]|uniref:DUF1120 domain-containing protein n=1 Tax=Pseudomonas sp. PS01301 TaxID=2991437 RepID=UPI00249BCD8D|nr:DUF1120 domain-containing protein [Pseudomonas sp. PS01301]